MGEIIKDKILLLLIGVFILGTFLRFAFLGEVPILHRDEAYLGYNAYSVLKTGKDISGDFLPLHFKSFLFSPGGYSYFSIPFIAVFGLNAFSVRFASAFFGSLTILLVYLIVLTVFQKEKGKRMIGLFSALFFAVSPWGINLSRTATENSIVVFFICLGLLLFIEWTKRQNFIILVSSVVSFAITLIVYQAPRAFLPIFIPFISIIFVGKDLLKKKIILLPFLYFFLILVPVFAILMSPQLSLRIQTLNIFQHPQTQITINEWAAADGVSDVPYILTRIFHNKIVGYIQTFSENLFNHLSYGFLFSDKGFPDRYRIPQSGLLYLFEIILLLISFVYLLSKKIRIGLFLVGWILISFSGAALTFDDIPNLQRTLIALPAFSILSGLGLYLLVDYIKKKTKFSMPILILIAMVFFFSVSFYILQYYSYGRIYRPWFRQDGYKNLVKEVNVLLPNYDKAVITTREGSPTIYFLFYSKYDPAKFQSETEGVDTKDSNAISFDKYEFSNEQCPLRIDGKSGKLTGVKNRLYVNSSLCDLPIENTDIITEIERVDGSKVFRLLNVK